MKKILSVTTLALSAGPALAHHPLGGMPMETLADGVLSGLGHPILGIDHLFFVIAMGLVAAYSGFLRSAPIAYIATMLLGCLLTSLGYGLPFKEEIIGLSLLVIGVVILTGRGLNINTTLALFAGFGLFHGSAFGESMAAQEAGLGLSVLVGYLFGLGALQYGIAVATGIAVLKAWNLYQPHAIQVRLAGAMIAGIGTFLTLENLEGFVLSVAGWAV